MNICRLLHCFVFCKHTENAWRPAWQGRASKLEFKNTKWTLMNFHSHFVGFHPLRHVKEAFLGPHVDFDFAYFAGHHSHMFRCSLPLAYCLWLSPTSVQVSEYGRDMFLVSDSCSMLNHVKPQLCALVWVCQEACSTVGACLTSRFHALSASKLANSCVFHQKWFLEMCLFSPPSSWGVRGGVGGVTGLGGRAVDKSEMCLILGGTALCSLFISNSPESCRLRFTDAGDNLKMFTSTWEVKHVWRVFS